MKKLVGILTAVGAINWLLVGLFNWNLVEFVFRLDWLITVVYVVVGLCGVVFLVKMCSCSSCGGKCEVKEERSPEPEAPSNDSMSQGENQM